MIFDQQTFRSELARMRFLDHSAVPFLSEGQWRDFSANPWLYFIQCSDEQQDAIWCAMERDRAAGRGGETMAFLEWWEKLNAALAARDEPDALYGEARDWYGHRPNWKNLEPSEERIINRVINARRPL